MQKFVFSLIHDLDHVFWNALEDLNLILGLIHEEQVQFEGGMSHFSLVVTR